jgi:hypothetical protein
MRDALANFLFLRDERAASRRIDESARAAMLDRLRLAQQRGTAGESLWSHGHTAEGLRLALDALAIALEGADELCRAMPVAAPSVPSVASPVASPEAAPSAPPVASPVASPEAPPEASPTAPKPEAERRADDGAEPSAPSEPSEPSAEPAPDRAPPDPPSLEAVLASRGFGRRAVERVETARKLLEVAPPLRDAEIGPEQAATYRLVVRARRHLETALRYPTMTPGEIGRAGVARWAGAIAVVGLLAVAVGYLAFPPPDVEARASSTFGGATSVYPPSLVIDGDETTRWLLPDNVDGWVEVTIEPPQPVRTVRFLNTDNPPWFDRATRGYRLEVFSPDGELVHASEGEYEQFERGPDWREVSMNVPEASRIRFTIKSHHGKSGGLAELAWEG